MITRGELIGALVAAGVPAERIKCHGAQYALPTETAVRKIGAAFADWLFSAGLSYKLGEMDCRSFTLEMVALARAAWRLTNKEQLPSEQYCDLAIGLFYFATRAHCIAVALHRSADGGVRVRWYEPQPGAQDDQVVFSLVSMLPVEMSEEDIKSCTDCFWP